MWQTSIAVLLLFLFLSCAGVWAQDKKNVLFIISDDFRPEIHASNQDPNMGYHASMSTPKLDALINDDGTFNFIRAYCQQSVCGPSRSSLLTGRRPDTIKVYKNLEYFRETTTAGQKLIQMFQHFRDSGKYNVYGLGKLFHPGVGANREMRKSFSKINKIRRFDDVEANQAQWTSATHNWQAVSGSEYNCADCLTLPDIKLTERAQEWLTEHKTQRPNKPFFMAVGYIKPHLPIVFPDKFLSTYSGSVSHPPNYKYPNNTDHIGADHYAKLRRYADIQAAGITGSLGEVETAVEDHLDGTSSPAYNKMIELRTAYYAALSYIDEQVGELRTTLDNLRLANDTIVVFLGDHGWHQMELSQLGKSTNFEMANRVPFILRVPGANGGTRSDLVELVDLFPTLAAAAGIEVPPACTGTNDPHLCTDGVNLLDPNHVHKTYAYSQFFRNNYCGSSGCYDLVGYSSKSATARYTAWTYQTTAMDKRAILLREYYDHTSDPGEQQNLAVSPISPGAMCSDIMNHEAGLEANLNLSLDTKLTC